MLSFVLFLCALTSVTSSEITSPPPPSPPASTMTLETWELSLIIGSGTLALLMCAYSVYILMRRQRIATPLTRVVVEIEEGRGKKESKAVEKMGSKTSAAKMGSKTSIVEKMGSKSTVAKMGSKTSDVEKMGSKTSAAKTESKSTVARKESKSTVAKTDARTMIAKPVDNGETGTEVIAVKIQPSKYAVTCPGGGKACIGARKEGVQTIPQPNQLPAPKIRRESAPSRISSGRNNAPRV